FGEIGFDALKYIMYHEDFKEVPKILETPYVAVGGDSKDKLPPYKQEIEMFRKGEFDPQNLERILGRL
ncbi:MAG: deoxyribonuclease IV, partial [Cellulosilyticum sp.]|nr:deoxyribonuclease IV [Cellulosilyticum sp.]